MVVDPGILFVGHETHRNASKEGVSFRFSDPVVIGSVVHVGGSAHDGIEGLEGGHQFSCGEQLDGESAVCSVGDAVCKTLSSCSESGKSFGPSGDETQHSFVLRQGRCGKGRNCSKGCGRSESGCGDKISSFHDELSFGLGL